MNNNKAHGPAADAWESQGYTPLLDPQILQQKGSTIMMDMGQDESIDGNLLQQQQPFFSMGPSASDDEPEMLVRENETGIERDFGSIADQALAALEADYLATLNMERNSAQVEEVPTVVPIPKDQPTVLMIDSEKELEEDVGDLFDRKEAADFQKNETDTALSPINNSAPHVDIQAVQKAISAIQLKDSKFSAAYASWEAQQEQEHPIIPKTQLLAFFKHTKKARRASYRLSRSATIAEALVRLTLLDSGKNVLQIHVVGCDHVECQSEVQIRTFFGPLVRWIGKHPSSSVQSVHIMLVGPNVPKESTEKPVVLSEGQEGSVRGIVSCHQGVYDEWLGKSEVEADLAIAFNAGVWGYAEWRTTFENLHPRSGKTPLVITAYTLAEAEEDFEVIRDVLKVDGGCLWKPQDNPFASREQRPTKSAPLSSQRYRENNAWQAWTI